MTATVAKSGSTVEIRIALVPSRVIRQQLSTYAFTDAMISRASAGCAGRAATAVGISPAAAQNVASPTVSALET